MTSGVITEGGDDVSSLHRNDESSDAVGTTRLVVSGCGDAGDGVGKKHDGDRDGAGEDDGARAKGTLGDDSSSNPWINISSRLMSLSSRQLENVHMSLGKTALEVVTIPSKLQSAVEKHIVKPKALQRLEVGQQSRQAQTVLEKMEVMEQISDPKLIKQTWIDLILSKEFTAIVDEVFDRCCKLNDTDSFRDADNSLDSTELHFAMNLLWEKLDDVVGGTGKLPRIKENEEEVLRTYDDNNDGHLSRHEFHGFARTYFSRMEWPLWRTAAKGAAKGLMFFFINRIFLSPAVSKVNSVVMPRVINTVKRKVSKKWKKKFNQAKRNLKLQLRKVMPIEVEDLLVHKNDAVGGTYGKKSSTAEKIVDIMPEDMLREIRRERLIERLRFVRNIVITSIVGATGALAGLL